ncbi:MAG: hypothetical protein IIU11_08910, partial [Bacteroidales bacterium]|nr:hypothetical protein [Bacteroidales bacterium]
PSDDNFKELTGEKTVEGVTITKEWKSGEGVAAGYTFSTAYGSVFFPAAGYDGGDLAGDEGNYWSSSPDDDYNAYFLYFFDGGALVVVAPGSVYSKYSVRLVRGL